MAETIKEYDFEKDKDTKDSKKSSPSPERDGSANEATDCQMKEADRRPGRLDS